MSSKSKKEAIRLAKENNCYWCEQPVIKKYRTRDHLIPLGMGGGEWQTVMACKSCNEERGRVTELYQHRYHLVRHINRCPSRITSYKNRFRKKVQKMSYLIIKWEILHRKKGIILPFDVLEIIRLDEVMPLLV